jgi:hypothetical protein
MEPARARTDRYENYRRIFDLPTARHYAATSGRAFTRWTYGRGRARGTKNLRAFRFSWGSALHASSRATRALSSQAAGEGPRHAARWGCAVRLGMNFGTLRALVRHVGGDAALRRAGGNTALDRARGEQAGVDALLRRAANAERDETNRRKGRDQPTKGPFPMSRSFLILGLDVSSLVAQLAPSTRSRRRQLASRRAGPLRAGGDSGS